MNILKALNNLSAVAALTIASVSFASTEHVHGPGTTYDIAEENAMEEIQRRGEEADVKSFVEETPRDEWSVWSGHRLPEAQASRRRRYVPWYTLEFDIPGPSGTIAYPKGFTFNPLEHVTYPGRIIIFKLRHYEQIEDRLKAGDVLIADRGDVVEASSRIGKNVSILDEKTAERLGVSVVPSIVWQEGTELVIEEIEAQ